MIRFSDEHFRTGRYACPPPTANPSALRGMVTAPHHLAAEAGLGALRSGGNAVDAAIAAAAVLAVVYPHMCTLGGDLFMLVRSGRTGEVKALNASGRSGANATREFYLSRGRNRA